MNSDDGEILVNDVSIGRTEGALGWGGYRRLHVVRMGEAVRREAWVEECVPMQCRNELLWIEYASGKTIQRFHLSMHWPCREMVCLEREGGSYPAAVWKDTSLRTSELIRLAAQEFFAATEAWPTLALIRGGEAGRKIPERLGLGEGLAEVRIEAVKWAPGNCAIVYEERHAAE